MCNAHTRQYLVYAKESNIICCYLGARNKRLHFRTHQCRNPQETQNSPSWQDVPVPISHTCLYVLSNSHLDSPVLNHCALQLYLYQLPQKDPKFNIISYPLDFNPLILEKWGLPLWTSSLLPTLWDTFTMSSFTQSSIAKSFMFPHLLALTETWDAPETPLSMWHS